jgi:hypothetical protein
MGRRLVDGGYAVRGRQESGILFLSKVDSPESDELCDGRPRLSANPVVNPGD